MKKNLLAAALLTFASLSGSLAQPVGSGGSGGTKTVCKWVSVPIVVVTGQDRNGFPIMHMELQQRLFCKTVPA